MACTLHSANNPTMQYVAFYRCECFCFLYICHWWCKMMVIHPIHWFWTRFGIICPGFEISLLTHTHRQNGLGCNCVCCAHSIKKNALKKTPSHRISVLVGLDNLQSSLSTDFIRATVSLQQKVAPMKTVYNQVLGFPRATETLFIERNTAVKNVLNYLFFFTFWATQTIHLQSIGRQKLFCIG